MKCSLKESAGRNFGILLLGMCHNCAFPNLGLCSLRGVCSDCCFNNCLLCVFFPFFFLLFFHFLYTLSLMDVLRRVGKLMLS